MVKRIKWVGLLALMLVLLLSTPIFAATPPSAPLNTVPIKQDHLTGGEQRLNQFTTIRANTNGTSTATVNSLPETLPNNTTAIDCTWYLITGAGNQQYYQSGTNLFTAIVKGSRVSVTDSSGGLQVWDTELDMGSTVYQGGTPTVVNDPFNSNYTNNTLEWTYHTGFLGLGTPIYRYLVLIEGCISEQWVIPSAPPVGCDIQFVFHSNVDKTALGNATWISAMDAKGNPLQVISNSYGGSVLVSNLNKVTYPVTVDPTLNFTTTADNTYLYNYSTSYTSILNSAVAAYVSTTSHTLEIGQAWDGTDYNIWKSTLYFPTSSIPAGSSISSASLNLYGVPYLYSLDGAFNIVIQNGQPTYPSMPAVAGDYAASHYSGNGGQISSAGWINSGYNTIALNPTGISWINSTGYTKLLVNSSLVIAGLAPTGSEELAYWAYAQGDGYQPTLTINYTTVPPTVTTGNVSGETVSTATVNGTLVADGGSPTSVNFQYDTTAAYNYSTSMQSGYSSGQNFSATLAGLLPGTYYYYRAQATNAGGTINGADAHVVTLPYPPDTFSATAGNSSVALAWVNGAGYQTTVIQRATGSTAPATPTSGTNIYNGAGTSTTDSTAINGTTYSYSAWSYVSYGAGALTQYSATYVTSTTAPSAPTTPSVHTLAAQNTVSTATLNGNLDSLGGYGTCNVWFQWGLTSSYGTTTSSVPQTSIGPFSVGLITLTPSTTYHFRADASNAAGTVNGLDQTFITGSASAPTMLTSAATGVQLTTATLNGTVTSDGGASVTVWFQYGLDTNYALGTTATSSGLASGDTYYYGLTGLTAATTYHYRAVGQNSSGTAYGLDESFTASSPSTPTVQTNGASLIGAHSAQLNGTLVGSGGATCSVEFEWSTTGAFSGEQVATGWQTGYTDGQTFSYSLTGLSTSTTYYFRADAKNLGGTVNGSSLTLLTVFGAPTGFSAKPISANTVNLSWTSQGDQTYIQYKAGSPPIDRDDGIQAYFGTASSDSISGLAIGTTYYFVAWSWATGAIWSPTTASAVATTFGGQTTTIAGGLAATPAPSTEVPLAPANWWQEPSGDYLQALPFYTSFNNLADTYQIPHGTAWFGLGMFLVFLALIVTFGLTREKIATALVGLFILFVVGRLHMLSLWLILPYLFLAGGFLFAFRSSASVMG
jgi:hypothetical protein